LYLSKKLQFEKQRNGIRMLVFWMLVVGLLVVWVLVVGLVVVWVVVVGLLVVWLLYGEE
jgi:fatty acid desaturase